MKENSMLTIAMRQVVKDCQAEGMKLNDAQELLLQIWMKEQLILCLNNQSVVAERENIHRNTVSRLLRNAGIVPEKGWKISRHVNA